MSLLRLRPLLAIALAAAPLLAACQAFQPWGSYGGSPQHTAISKFASAPLQRIMWSTPVDLFPQYSGSDLLIHYGSPLITFFNTVVVTVKTGTNDGFRVEGRRGSDGALLWSQDTDYTLPPHGWTPSCGSTLTRLFSLATPGAGGTVYIRRSADIPSSTVTQFAFYGLPEYKSHQASFDQNVKICTPITSDNFGNLFFGFRVYGQTDIPLSNGWARISNTGVGTWVSTSSASGNNSSSPLMNCVPALSNDGHILYVVGVGNGADIIGLDTTTLHTVYKKHMLDPNSGNDALCFDDGTASPMVGPDGDVYMGTLENPFGSNHLRGFMLHYDKTLSTTKLASAFGWDDTASLVPASAIISYTGPSHYLLLTKYNNYVEGGGDGVNKVAVVDPNVSMIDPISGATVMNAVISIAGPTPDANHRDQNHPNAVREWCINTAAIDTLAKCALVNNEDGKVYRWDFTTNTLTQVFTLTAGIGEAYTPTLIGAKGTCYAINNAVLFALGPTAGPGHGGAVAVVAGERTGRRQRR